MRWKIWRHQWKNCGKRCMDGHWLKNRIFLYRFYCMSGQNRSCHIQCCKSSQLDRSAISTYYRSEGIDVTRWSRRPWRPNFWHILSICALRGGVPNKILLPASN